MPRPKNPRRCGCTPRTCCFRPQNSPCGGQEVILEKDEFEALKLYDLDNLEQKDAAEEMAVSQPTFARILKKTHRKIAEAIIEGKVLRLKS